MPARVNEQSSSKLSDSVYLHSDVMPYHSMHSNGYSSDGQMSPSAEESPTFVMEHLATFTVSKETGIVYPADGMRRLLQLEKSNGIWSQKMQLRLDRSWVLIMDYETGAVMERFPATLIHEPTAFTSHDPMEIYNNILVFIVGDERQMGSRSEMHIFQCQSISAQELVEDLKLLRMGKSPRGGRARRHIPPPPPTPPPDPPLINGVNVREQVSVFNAVAHQPDVRGGSELGVAPGHHRDDETSSTSSEKYERDVTILNHCFDDIEKFIARLQHAAAASKELERRRRNRKSKKKDMGDGMLTMRAKPPPESEFIDIFQKFKLSLILLAKLKHHIHDPNAPELVHFLFTPLALIVDASHDTHYLPPNLPSKVVCPLLTQEAINLLINCVTSKETELWHSLGDAWLIPREQWKGYVAPYHPVFMDGWSPDYPISEDRDVLVPAEGKRTREDTRPLQHESEHYHRGGGGGGGGGEREHEDYSSDYWDPPPGEYDRQESSPADPRALMVDRRNFEMDHRYGGRAEREHSQSPGGSEPEFAGASPSHMGPPIPSARSDISADSIERNSGANSERFERSQALWLEELRSNGAKVVQVTYPRTANNDKELTVIRGEFLEVLDDSRKWWKARNSRGQVAHVPHTIVTSLQQGEVGDVFSNPLYAPHGYDSQAKDAIRGEGLAGGVPMPPTPSPAPAPADWVRKERQGKKAGPNIIEENEYSEPTAVDLLNSELKSVLGITREGGRKKMEFINTPSVYINQNASAADVSKWLEQKRFPESTSTQLRGMDAKDLFNLSKSQLQQICGPEEGKRLYHLLILQKNMSGFQTTRTLELCEKLARARMKAEQSDQTESIVTQPDN
ncbi:epidermal growth factor receptor kinase substrate 8 isoform X1 [Nilaparvata lugens]|uniref:epidermal growth factor receptor kinase substrate 8 isoform X1 n=1 Tax=Nilaparvata lugens TaxID=108931 RepID=UPI000B97DE8E|nr:epidermal growth factor receptor kinase substrate 8 isoform X1 [Nilaparvata lugens]XP_039298517.1 epidermal growth factor receptor kinase substrate 8 isoform X1 [Nilaparvata lugens]